MGTKLLIKWSEFSLIRKILAVLIIGTGIISLIGSVIALLVFQIAWLYGVLMTFVLICLVLDYVVRPREGDEWLFK